MLLDQTSRWAASALLLLCLTPRAPAQPVAPAPILDSPPPVAALPAYLPRYKVGIDLDIAGRAARVRQEATWINPHTTPTQQLVFNAHSRYVVPDNEIGFMAKMLEILRVQAGESLGYKDPPLEIHKVTLVGAGPPLNLNFHYEGDTKTSLVVDLPFPVGPGGSVTVVLDETILLNEKMGRWGHWEDVTFLSNWLPVFAFYGNPTPPRAYGDVAREGAASGPRVVRAASETGAQALPALPGVGIWQPTPFVPWHQPFFNEAGVYDVSVVLPCDQEIGCTGKVVATTPLPNGKKRVDIQAVGVREFTFLCSARYQVFEGQACAGPGGAAVRIRILAFKEHEFYANHMVRIVNDALTTYSKQFGPYPWPDFTITEAFFGWNGNECSTLVMIDERVFAMPHVAVGYVEYLVSHETCHQWWYNLVGTNGYCETWMDEAMANYFSHRLMNKKLGRDNALMNYPSGLEWLPKIRREDYRSCGMYSTIGKGECTPIIQEMPKFGHLGNLFNLCYDKGGRIVGMIEDRLGEAAFFDFMRCVAMKYRYRILRVADFQRELEAYTGSAQGNKAYAWDEFFQHWLFSTGISDWSVGKVTVTGPPKCLADSFLHGLLGRRSGSSDDPAPPGGYHVEVLVEQKADYNEQTCLGFALPGAEGYPIRVPIMPCCGSYQWEEGRATVTALPPTKKGGARMKVEIVLPCRPTQIAIDPDEMLVDANPTNNYWKPEVRWRVTPLYTFLEETDLTSAYDKWNVILGPWVYTPAYYDPWFTRSTMLGARVGLYRTQEFDGGVYTAYRTDFRDVVAGVDGVWDHFPLPHMQVGFVAEQRVLETESGDPNALHAAVWARYILTYGSSLYLPPFQYVDLYAHYSNDFFPYATQPGPGGVRFDETTTMGLHYRVDYLTPYWDPEGGFRFEAAYEGGLAQLPSTVGVQMLWAQFSMVKSAPNLGKVVDGPPWLKKALDWFSDTRFAFRAYGATSAPSKGEFFTLGSDTLFRGFDTAQRQGSTVWIGSVEWRVPLVQRVEWDAADHVVGLRNAYLALFCDSGDAYVSGHQIGSVAYAAGAGLRLDVSWFSFVERSTLRLDVAQTVNSGTGVQVWVGINHPF